MLYTWLSNRPLNKEAKTVTFVCKGPCFSMKEKSRPWEGEKLYHNKKTKVQSKNKKTKENPN